MSVGGARAEVANRKVVGPDDGVEVSLVESLDELAEPTGAWDALLDAALPGRGLFLRLAMLRATQGVHASGTRSPFILLARRAGALVGALPLVLDRKPTTRAGLRLLSLWGDDGSALGFEEDLPLLGDPASLLRAFRAALLGPLRDRFDVMRLGYLRADSRCLTALRDVFFDGEWSEEPLTAHTLDLSTSFEAYRATRSGSALRKLSQRRRKLHAAHEVTCRVLSSLDDGDLEAVLQLHTARQAELSARGRHREFIARDHERRATLIAILRAAEQLGAARHFLLHADGVLVSFLLTFVRDGSMHTGPTAINESFAEYGPGTLIFWEAVQDAFARGDVSRIEFGPGTTTVKQLLGTDSLQPARLLWVKPGAWVSRLRWATYRQLVAIRGRLG